MKPMAGGRKIVFKSGVKMLFGVVPLEKLNNAVTLPEKNVEI